MFQINVNINVHLNLLLKLIDRYYYCSFPFLETELCSPVEGLVSLPDAAVLLHDAPELADVVQALERRGGVTAVHRVLQRFEARDHSLDCHKIATYFTTTREYKIMIRWQLVYVVHCIGKSSPLCKIDLSVNLASGFFFFKKSERANRRRIYTSYTVNPIQCVPK